jgi:hypothetical protein
MNSDFQSKNLKITQFWNKLDKPMKSDFKLYQPYIIIQGI